MIVVDVGCLSYTKRFQVDESLRPLLRRFQPDLYFGFDIYPEMADGETQIDGTHCVFMRRAAWVHNGSVGVVEQGNCTHIDLTETTTTVQSFDFGAFLALLPEGLTVKIDIEGSEYPLLWDLYRRDLDQRIGLLLVEWHRGRWANGHSPLRPPLRCETEEWH